MATKSIKPFIRTAEKAGMPVNILRFVENRFKIQTGDGNHTNPDTNTITLTQPVWQGIQSATIGKVSIDKSGKPFVQLSEAPEVAALYHEAAHAYADVKLGPRKPETTYPNKSESLTESTKVKSVFK